MATASATGPWKPSPAMADPVRTAWHLDRRTRWLVVPLAMVIAPHLLYTPAWVGLAAGGALLWRLAPGWRKDHAGQRVVRGLLAGAALLGVLLQFHTLLGPQPGISLLVLMTALKLLESEGPRDHIIGVLAGYFLLMAVLIHHQQLAMAAWLAASAVALTASLIVNQRASPPPVRQALGQAGLLMVQALPLALVLFLLFPRLPSPVGGLVRTEVASTGLSDTMTPGSVSQLIQSDAVAFRVDFAQAGVALNQLYWRGPVLSEFDGRAWRRTRLDGGPPEGRALGAAIDYSITLEPSAQPWLPVAGLADRIDLPLARVSSQLEWSLARPRQERLRYTVRAWLDYRLDPDRPPLRQAANLALPEGSNPDTVALARRWAAETPDPQALVRRALEYFRSEPFHYTLSPPRLGEQPMDDFLFVTRRGFCEHYAGAFTVLMRAAGVPARVVTGYQGGELNPIGGYGIVRQRDAHAWAEVWLPGEGWRPVDPTAAVAPDRIERGIGAALPAAELPRLGLAPDWLRPLRQTWDFVNNGWNQWVLGYDFERQRRLLTALSPSLGTLRGLLWALLGMAGLVVGGLALWVLRDAAGPRRQGADRLYDRFATRLARIGLTRGRAEGPEDFAARAAARRPDLATPIRTITGLYVGLRYGGLPGARLGELKRAVRAFRPGRAARRGVEKKS